MTTDQQLPICLNLGCGSTFHSDWRNLDIAPHSNGVEKWDSKNGIPSKNQSVDFIYHSHMLEHLSEDDAKNLIKECHRVLKPQGVIRIAVPDLEIICREFLNALSRIDRGEKNGKIDADWMRLELFDQMTRETSGGMMTKCLESDPLNKDFIIKRCGEQVRPILEKDLEKNDSPPLPATIPIHLRFKIIIKKFICMNFMKDCVAKIVLDESDYKALVYGRFYFSGEKHKQMYDRISLTDLLQKSGFSEVIIQSPIDSLIPNWSTYYLDINSEGVIRKPDSLYVEGIKPA
jgi:predicted SAM-dependent methyltransferase